MRIKAMSIVIMQYNMYVVSKCQSRNNNNDDNRGEFEIYTYTHQWFHNKMTTIKESMSNYRHDANTIRVQWSEYKVTSTVRIEGRSTDYCGLVWLLIKEVSASTDLARLSMRASRAASAADMVDGGVSRLFGRLSAARSRLGERLRLLEEFR